MNATTVDVEVKQNWPWYKREGCTLSLLYLVARHRYVDEAYAGHNNILFTHFMAVMLHEYNYRQCFWLLLKTTQS